MVLAALIALVQSLLYYAILFYVGKTLTYSEQLRAFLGFRKNEEKSYNYSNVTYFIEKIGDFISLLAIIGGLYTIVNTIIIISRS